MMVPCSIRWVWLSALVVGQDEGAVRGQDAALVVDQRQVQGAEVALVHNEGGILSSHCTLILANDKG